MTWNLGGSGETPRSTRLRGNPRIDDARTSRSPRNGEAEANLRPNERRRMPETVILGLGPANAFLLSGMSGNRFPGFIQTPIDCADQVETLTSPASFTPIAWITSL